MPSRTSPPKGPAQGRDTQKEPESLLTTFHVSPWFQKEEPSSKLKRVPPIGAPKAAATPAAAPADTKSLLSLK